MQTNDEKLERILLRQPFSNVQDDSHDARWQQMQQAARILVAVEGGFAVLSDMMTNRSFICASDFGSIAGIARQEMVIDSIFEDDIFRQVHPDDLLQKHAQELRFFNFIKPLPLSERSNYHTRCVLRFTDAQSGSVRTVLHRMSYHDHHADGSIGIALCLYTPSYGDSPLVGINAQIANSSTGEIVSEAHFARLDKQLLSRREVEILSRIAHGEGTKQIAERLCISPNTVQRHRQNIMQHLHVNNCAEAVHLATYMGLL